MDNLLKLAERCEAATGPCIGLDADIELATGNWSNEHHQGWYWYQGAGTSANPPLYEPSGPAPYTASLDAAMTLVPEGLSVALYVHPDESHADVYRIHPSKGRLGEAEQAKSPALAVCAAALRARSSVTVRGE